MAIYHLSSGFISRSTGRSSVQNAAYITGEKIHESRRGIDVNYQNRSNDVAFSLTLLPDHAPQDLANSHIWDKVESFEDKYAHERFPNGEVAREKYMNSAQTAMTMIVALPKEISLDSSKELVSEFLKERFVSRGLVCTFAIHENSGNPHAHFLISRRSINEKGDFSWLKDRAICTKRELLKTRSLWADKTNFYLERDGFDTRITEKSFLDLDVDLKPTKHHGWYAEKLIYDGESSRIIQENEKIYLDNKQKIEITPTVILDEITSKQATFSQKDLLKTIQKRVGDDVDLVSYVFETCLKEAHYVGDHFDGMRRYTSMTYQKSEENALCLLKEFNGKTVSHTIRKEDIASTVETYYSYFSSEQKQAVFGLLKEDSLSVLIGRAGAGKTTTLKAVSDCYKQNGFNVIGCSLSAVASENLGTEADIQSSTLHSLLYKLDTLKEAESKFLSFNAVMEEGLFKQLDWYQDLKRYEHAKLTDKTVIIVDEAGMVGAKLWQNLLSHAKAAGSKIIAVGDDNQFKPVDAGDFFRAIKEASKENLFTLNDIRRQKIDWMKQASLAFSKLDVQEGLTAYHKNGFVHESDKNMISTDIAKDYIHHLKQGKDVAVLAYTNSETHGLNEEIRSLLKQDNMLDKETILTLGDKHFNRAEKLVFLKNDKINVAITNQDGEKVKDAFIKNGSVGTLLKADDQGNATVLLKDQTFAHFNINAYKSIDYGYALTCHKSQGQTVDITLVKANKMLESKALYVAMTRHREEAHLYYSSSDFKSFNHLKMSLSNYQDKDLVKDYTIQTQQEAAWKRVEEYKLCRLDLAHMKANKQDVDPKEYQAIRQEQITLGKEILKDFENHKTFINQSGMTREMVEITTGLKQRPLTLLEEQAKLRVELYGQTAENARTLWKDLKGKDLNINKEQYQAFKTMRDERNALAKDILESYKIHAPFIKEHAKEYLISKKTLMKHVESQNVPTVDRSHHIKEQNITIKHNERPLPTFTKTSHDIVDSLNNNIKDIATHFLGKPTSQTSREWRYGKKGSISIHVAGQKQGLYANFETGDSGNVVKFIADQMGIDNKEAFKWGVEYLGVGNKTLKQTVYESKEKSQPTPVQEKQWIPTYPVTVPYPDLKREKQLGYMLKNRHEVSHFEYKDADGKTLGFVVRLEDKEGNKITPTLTYCQNDTEKGIKQWRFQGFGNDRPIYGLDVIKQKQDAPVLIVEGEKTCEAARLIFKDHAVITWSGGCGSVQKSDWSVLKDRDVTIWPDHDKAGENAAHKIAAILSEKDIKSLAIIDLPSTLPHKWDLADKLPDGFSHDELMSHKVIQTISQSQKTHTDVQEKERIKEDQEKIDHTLTYLKEEIAPKENQKQESFKCMEKEEVQKIAKALGTSLSKNYTDFELSLINILYKSYKEMEPHADSMDLKIKAISVGIYMHTYLDHLGFNGQFNEENFNKSYKLSLKAYYSIEKVGNFNKAFDHAHNLLEKEKNIDHHLNNDLHQSSSHHHDNPIHDHTQNVFSYIKEHEKTLAQMHTQHQQMIDQQRQHEIQQQHHISRGFEREL